MAAGRDLTSMGRDLVMKAFDGLADRVGDSDSTPDAVRQVADKWKAMSGSDREEIARRIAVAVEGALTVIPLAAVAAASAAKRARAKKNAQKPASSTQATAAAQDGKDQKDKKREKKKKKDEKKKDKKKKKNKKKKK